MSETETLVGKLIPESIHENLEKTAERILFANGWGIGDYHDSAIDALRDEGCEKYYVTEDAIFKVEMSSDDPYDDIFIAKTNPDKSVDFVLKYYNGGCSFGEAVEAALKQERSRIQQ